VYSKAFLFACARLRADLAAVKLAHIRQSWEPRSLLRVAPIQRIERKQEPADVAPKRGFIAAEVIECEIGQIDELDSRTISLHLGVGKSLFYPSDRAKLRVDGRSPS
jgi:hypothetical protein